MLSIIFVPVYLRYIGIESYGLIGIFSSLQAFISLLDFGLSPTINRELARLAGDEKQHQQMLDLKRTLEVPNWITALLIALMLSALAPLIANSWVQTKNLSASTVTNALLIIAINLAIQFSVNFYSGGLMGLQRQFLVSAINIFCGTVRAVGALVVLVFVSPSIEAFLIWQSIVVVIQLLLVVASLQKSLPKAETTGRFQLELLKNVKRFAAGMTGLSILGLIVSQTDKIILSRMLSLEMFGYYVLAVTISTMATGTVAGAITQTMYPKFSRLVSLGNEKELCDLYHKSCQMMSVLLMPIVVMLAMFSYEVLLIWLGNDEIAANTYVLLSLVAIGNGLHSLLYLPHSLQMAYGWTRLSLLINLSAILVLVPLVIFGVQQYGAIGGAAGWLVMNIFFLLTDVNFMHKRILIGEQSKWYVFDFGYPLLTCLLIAGIGKFLLPIGLSRIGLTAALFLLGTVVVIVVALTTQATRQALRDWKNVLLVRL